MISDSLLRKLFAAFAMGVMTHCLCAQEPAKVPQEKPKIEELADGRLKIGEVVLDKKKRSITFPAAINLDKGEMEYLLVQEGGKTHESLFVTKVLPTHIHIAMLLLGVKLPQQPAIAPPPQNIDANYLKSAPKPKGEDVTILVRWTDNGKTVEMHGEDLMFDQAKKQQMSRGPWIYNGSIESGGVFLAQQERSIISMIIDPAALVNNERPDSDNDQVWTIISEKCPKVGTPVEITLQLPAQ